MQALVLPTSPSKFPLLFHFLDHTLRLVTSLILLHSYLYILALFVFQLFLVHTYLSKNVWVSIWIYLYIFFFILPSA